MKLKTIVATALINRFALSFLWVVVAIVMVGTMSNDKLLYL
jgi:hypothetical protein